MSNVSAYETAAGKRYRVRYRTPDNRQTDRRGFKTKRDAEEFAATVTVAKLRGEYVDASRSRAKIDELGPAWLGRKTSVKPSTRRALESAWRVHVQPRWGRTVVTAIEPTAVQDWVNDLSAKGLSPTTVKRALGVLSGILDEAIKERRILANPCRGTPTPRKETKDRVYLEHHELHRFSAECGNHQTLVLVLGYCGIRWGEATGLRVKDIDFTRRRLNINQNAVEIGSEIIVGTPKTHERRSVPFPQMLEPGLRELCADKLPGAYVFTSVNGGHLRRTRSDSNSGGWFSGAVRRAGLPRITPHDLRHTAASLAISEGANVKAVQRMLGHKSAAMTLDVYSGLFDDDLDAVAVALNRAGEKYMSAG